MCIWDKEPLSFVERDGFRNFIKREFPGYIIPDRHRITEIIIPDRHTMNSASAASLSTAFKFPSREGPWRASAQSAAPALTKRLSRGRRRIYAAPLAARIRRAGPRTSSRGGLSRMHRPGSCGTLPEQAGGNWGETTGGCRGGHWHAGGREAGGWLSGWAAR